MKIRSSEIVVSAIRKEQYPAEGLPEIALVGRSNVGKSSATNALLNRRNFARTSQTPGKTRTINFYKINNEFYFVDLPGYGYAKVSKSEKDKWGVIMERYLQDRQELCAIFLLVDIRHEPTNDDVMMYEWIKHFGYNCVVIATKADKISRGQYQKHISIIRKKLQLEKDEKVIPLSSSKKTGVEDVWNEIIAQYEEHGYEITVDIKPEHQMEKVLYAVDELTGLIGAVVIMRPSKSVQDLEVKSVKKKYKSKGFAAGCSREVIQRGADMLDWSLDELIQRTIDALKTFRP